MHASIQHMRFIILFCVFILHLGLHAQSDTTRKGQGRGMAGIFFKRYFDFRNSGAERKYKKAEKDNERLSFPWEEGNYSLVFEDNFDSLNTQVWGIGQPWGRFHGHHPHQYYGDTEVFVNDGLLHLQNRFAPQQFTYKDSQITIPYGTGLIHTYNSASFTYGYFAIRSKNPVGPATWPAFWLTGKYNWPPEIDIFEMYGKCSGEEINTQTMSLHFGKIEHDNKATLTKKVSLNETTDSAFHIYSCLWEPNKINFYTDGVLLKVIPLNSWMQQFYQEPMVVILNNAVDHNYLDCIDNSKMPVDFIVDWIKIYQKTN